MFDKDSSVQHIYLGILDTLGEIISWTLVYNPDSNHLASNPESRILISNQIKGWANNYDDLGVYRSFGWLLKITADGCVDTLCTTTSLLEQIQDRQTKVKVYPNPAREYVIFDIAEDIQKEVRAEIYDLNGRALQTQVMRTGVHVMMLDDGRYSAGLYVWRVVESNGKVVSTGKVLIQ